MREIASRTWTDNNFANVVGMPGDDLLIIQDD